MASSSISPINTNFLYDVFLSFRGEDTRKNFVDHLYYALEHKSIHTYKDDERIKKGKRISDDIIKSIEHSRFHIIVFSKNYASSSWCLDELVKIMECHTTTQHSAYPVFYDVQPCEVRKQSGAVGEAFAKYKNEEAAAKWRHALEEAAHVAGWELKNTANGHEAKLIQHIVEEISLELRSISPSTEERLIGMETRVKDVVSSLEASHQGVRMIGIKGIGGGGKTTLARAIFDQISFQFEGRSFVENVREVSKASLSGLKSLQQQVISDVQSDQDITISSVYDGKKIIKKMMCFRKVLVVLDDVDNIDQLEALAGDPNWFKSGSRIIITTRDEQVLVAHRVNFVHDINLLSHEEAICLFSRYAFGGEIPIPGYQVLSEKVVRYAAGLPLTIRVLGSFLCGKTKPEWIDAVERLKKIPLKETLEKLELSYNDLENDYKEIFLDVACIMKGQHKEHAIRVLESCGLHARNGLRVLEQKSLITISNGGYLGMHDHIEEMGRNIVRHLHPDEPHRHSRLWIDEEIKDILANNLGTEAINCIRLSTMEPDLRMVTRGLASMKKLRVIYMYSGYGKFDEFTQNFPNVLRYLTWRLYPFGSLPKTFEADNLVGLEIIDSRIVCLWKGGERKVLHNLRFLNLSNSKMKTFDLELTPNLERLSLKYCCRLVELHMPDACLKLLSLDLSSSYKLRALNLGCAPNLETLFLNNCNKLEELQMPVGCPKLKFLYLRCTALRTLDLGLTRNLERLDLHACGKLIQLHAPVGCLEKLVYLDLSQCERFKCFSFHKKLKTLQIDSLSDLHLIARSVDTCPLHLDNNSPKFQLTCYYKEHLPSSTGNLERLISVGLCSCTNMETFSESICGLRFLRKLTFVGSIPEVPKDLGRLQCLQELVLSTKWIKHLPDSICMLKHLQSLELESCWLLESLPEDLGRLECLQKLRLTGCLYLQGIPNSICKIKRLKYFYLLGCVAVEELPEDFGFLEGLKELNLEGSGVNNLPQSIFLLKGLRIVGYTWLLQSYGFTISEIPSPTSDHLAFCHV